jgi:hypothetical protein
MSRGKRVAWIIGSFLVVVPTILAVPESLAFLVGLGWYLLAIVPAYYATIGRGKNEED